MYWDRPSAHRFVVSGRANATLTCFYKGIYACLQVLHASLLVGRPTRSMPSPAQLSTTPHMSQGEHPATLQRIKGG